MKDLHNNKSPQQSDEIEQAIRFHIHQIHQSKHAQLENNPPSFTQMYQHKHLLNQSVKTKSFMTRSWAYALLLLCVGSYYLMSTSSVPKNAEYASQTYTDFNWENDDFEWLLDTEWLPDET